MKKYEWSNEDLEYLKNNYPSVSSKLIAKDLNKPVHVIYSKAYKLGLKKSEEFLKSPDCGRLYPGCGVGKEHRFKKGQIPHNKGEKMSAEAKEKIKHTFFKKGHKPHNTRCDGDTSIKDGYLYLRVSMGNWVLLHRHNWEAVNGEIPSGFNLVFKDGNRLNCELSNLELVSDAELMQRNTIQRYPEELQTSFRLLGKINRKIQKHEK